jgi:FkbM family methyltransferase
LVATTPRRRIAALGRAPALATAQTGGKGHGLRGVPRLRRKLVKKAHRLVHGVMGVPARGEIVVDPDGAAHAFAADFANTAYIDFFNRAEAGGYEPEVTALLDVLAPRLGVVYDAGANWGYYVAALMTHPRFRGEVHAFEIAPRTRRDLAALVDACGFAGRVRCHPYGLSDAPGTLAVEEGAHSFLTRVSERGRGARMRVETLDALDLPDPDLVKIDVEGHEAAVLRGAKGRLARAKPIVVFESWWRPDAEAAMLAPLALLADLGYRFFRMAHRIDGDTVTLTLAPLRPENRPSILRAADLVAVHTGRFGLLADFGATEGRGPPAANDVD